MSAIEQDITSVIARLKARQSELAGQYGVVTRVIEALEKSLDDLEALPTPSNDAMNEISSQIESAVIEDRQPTVRENVNRVLPDTRLTDPATFFNLSQSQAIIKLMRTIKRPVTMLEILDILKGANYPIKAKVPYQSLFSVMTRDKAFVKRGKLWGLKEWSEGGANNEATTAPPVARVSKRGSESGATSGDAETSNN